MIGERSKHLQGPGGVSAYAYERSAYTMGEKSTEKEREM